MSENQFIPIKDNPEIENYTIKDLEELPTHVLLSEVFPENLILMKDSGVWGVWEDDSDDAIYFQEDNEPFSYFIKRIIVDMMNKEQPDSQGFTVMAVDYAIAEVEYREGRFNEEMYLIRKAQ